MQVELKTKWLAALRSGKYQQGRTTLRDKQERYCCLGVLCDVSEAGTWGDDQIPGAYTYVLPQWSVSKDWEAWGTSVLPSTLLEQVGISEAEQGELVTMNDTGRSNFNTIADWIEKNL